MAETCSRWLFFRGAAVTRGALGIWSLALVASVFANPSASSLAADNPLVLRVPTQQGRDVAYATLPDRGGNFYVAGLIDDPAATSTFGVAKFSSQGELLWQRNYNGRGTSRSGAVRHMALDAEGGIVATGTVETTIGSCDTERKSRQEVLTVKYASDGTQLWAHSYVGAATEAIGMRVAIDARGDTFVGGSSTRRSADWLLLKYDRLGNLLLERLRDGAARANDHIVDMQLGSDGTLAVAGYSAYPDSASGLQTVIAKFDANGRELWSRTYLASGQRDSIPVDLAVDSADEILITGLTAANLLGAGDAVIPYAIKLGRQGSLRMELNGADAGGASVDVDANRDFVLAGAISRDIRTPALAGALASAVSKYDRQGNRLWMVSLGAVGTLEVASARIAENGTVFVAGTISDSRSSDYALLKLSSDGKTLWEHRYAGNGGGFGHASQLALNGGRTLVLGQHSTGESGYDLVALLYGELAPKSVRRGQNLLAE